LLSEKQCIARNTRRQETQKQVKRRQHRLGVVSVQGRQVTAGQVTMDDCVSAAAAAAAGGSASQCQTPPHCRSPLQLLTDEHRDLIGLIVAYQDKYELATEEDTRKVSVSLAATCLSVCLSVCCRHFM